MFQSFVHVPFRHTRCCGPSLPLSLSSLGKGTHPESPPEMPRPLLGSLQVTCPANDKSPPRWPRSPRPPGVHLRPGHHCPPRCPGQEPGSALPTPLLNSGWVLCLPRPPRLRNQLPGVRPLGLLPSRPSLRLRLSLRLLTPAVLACCSPLRLLHPPRSRELSANPSPSPIRLLPLAQTPCCSSRLSPCEGQNPARGTTGPESTLLSSGHCRPITGGTRSSVRPQT